MFIIPAKRDQVYIPLKRLENVMESRARTFAKTMTWQSTGLISMAIMGYIATGSFTAAGGLAVASTALGTVTYVLHERIWARIGWGRKRHADPI